MSRCWWRGHRWSLWRDVNIINEIGAIVSRQERHCFRCGISDRRIP